MRVRAGHQQPAPSPASAVTTYTLNRRRCPFGPTDTAWEVPAVERRHSIAVGIRTRMASRSVQKTRNSATQTAAADAQRHAPIKKHARCRAEQSRFAAQSNARTSAPESRTRPARPRRSFRPSGPRSRSGPGWTNKPSASRRESTTLRLKAPRFAPSLKAALPQQSQNAPARAARRQRHRFPDRPRRLSP